MHGFILIVMMILASFPAAAQSASLADNYVDHGEYAKAEAIYKQLYEKQPNAFNYLKSLVTVLQEQLKYDKAADYLEDFASRNANYPGIYVEIGYNYQRQEQAEQAEKYYKKALDHVSQRPNYAYRIGEAFQKYSLLEKAEKTYQLALKEKQNPNFSIRLARIYGEQGNFEQMFATFLDLVAEQQNYYTSVRNDFARYVNSNPENEANQTLRKLLLKRLQQTPNVFYNRMLSWLFVQENQFEQAFIQERAVYARSTYKSLSYIIRLARLAAEEQQYESAEKILNFAITHAQTTEQEIYVHHQLMAVKLKHAKPEDYIAIEQQFRQLLTQYGKALSTLKIQLQYANFLAFTQHKTKEAKALLTDLLHYKIRDFEKARIKMKLADVLVAEENFNQALIYYSQITDLVAHSPLAQEARFKVAKTSYYKGDFEWAQTQLKILKEATSELTANNAIALNLLIEENTEADSTQTALKLFAKADLFSVQGKIDSALAVFDTLLTHHRGDKIEDQALLKSAKLYEDQAAYHKAEKAYKKIIKYYEDGVLVDDAYYYLAELYRTKLQQLDAAMENYKQLIFHHADSIFYVAAQKAFRKLRGDVFKE